MCMLSQKWEVLDKVLHEDKRCTRKVITPREDDLRMHLNKEVGISVEFIFLRCVSN